MWWCDPNNFYNVIYSLSLYNNIYIIYSVYLHISDRVRMSVSVAQLISGIKALPEETKMKMAAVIGAIVADAASLPLQWIYDDKVMEGIHIMLSHATFNKLFVQKMQEVVGSKDPEFWPESHCPFFR